MDEKRDLPIKAPGFSKLDSLEIPAPMILPHHDPPIKGSFRSFPNATPGLKHFDFSFRIETPDILIVLNCQHAPWQKGNPHFTAYITPYVLEGKKKTGNTFSIHFNLKNLKPPVASLMAFLKDEHGRLIRDLGIRERMSEAAFSELKRFIKRCFQEGGSPKLGPRVKIEERELHLAQEQFETMKKNVFEHLEKPVGRSFPQRVRALSRLFRRQMEKPKVEKTKRHLKP